MERLERILIEHECARLLYKFLRLFEHEHSKAADLFTEDGSMHWLSIPGSEPLVGADAIRKSFLQVEEHAGREINLLLVNNVVVDVIDENNATGQAHVTHYQYVRKDEKDEAPWPLSGPPRVISRWVTEYKRVDGEWKIARQTNAKDIWLRKAG